MCFGSGVGDFLVFGWIFLLSLVVVVVCFYLDGFLIRVDLEVWLFLVVGFVVVRKDESVVCFFGFCLV